MKTIKLLFLFLIMSSVSVKANEDWGKTGHRATGEIAENHLTKKSQERNR